MKKIVVLILTLIFIFTITTMPTSAETNANDWAKSELNGAKISFNEEGTKIILVGGMGFYYYKKQVNVRDFTCKIKLNAPNFDNWGCWMITIGNGVYSGSSTNNTNVIFLWPKPDGKLVVQPSILYGSLIGSNPQVKNFTGDFKNKDIIIRGKKVNDTTYSLDFNNGEFYYEYPIPENQNYVESLGNGMGYLGFGTSETFGTNNYNFDDGSYNILVKEINGVKMNGKESVSSNPAASANSTNSNTSSTTTSTNSDKTSSTNSGESSVVTESTNSGTTGTITEEPIPNTNNNSDKNNKSANEEKSKNNNIILIVIGSLVMIPFIVIAIIIISKKKSAKASVQDVVNEKLQE